MECTIYVSYNVLYALYNTNFLRQVFMRKDYRAKTLANNCDKAKQLRPDEKSLQALK